MFVCVCVCVADARHFVVRSSGWGGTLHYSKDAAYVDHRPSRHHTCAFTCSWLCLYLNMAVVRACPSLSTPPSADKVWPLAHIAVSVVVRADGWRVCGWEVLTHAIFASSRAPAMTSRGRQASELRRCANAPYVGCTLRDVCRHVGYVFTCCLNMARDLDWSFDSICAVASPCLLRRPSTFPQCSFPSARS